QTGSIGCFDEFHRRLEFHRQRHEERRQSEGNGWQRKRQGRVLAGGSGGALCRPWRARSETGGCLARELLPVQPGEGSIPGAAELVAHTIPELSSTRAFRLFGVRQVVRP